MLSEVRSPANWSWKEAAEAPHPDVLWLVTSCVWMEKVSAFERKVSVLLLHSPTHKLDLNGQTEVSFLLQGSVRKSIQTKQEKGPNLSVRYPFHMVYSIARTLFFCLISDTFESVRAISCAKHVQLVEQSYSSTARNHGTPWLFDLVCGLDRGIVHLRM